AAGWLAPPSAPATQALTGLNFTAANGFVDEEGKFSPQGPDYLGQTRRLRTGDGVYFTKFGARKLAHYVEREIERIVGNKSMPVALPVPVGSSPQPPNPKPARPAHRPLALPDLP